jgi:type II secretory pathway pseudopilin PulG
MLRHNQRGFTVTELIISIVVFNILIVGVFFLFTDFFATVVRSEVSAQITIDSQNILRDIVEEIRVGSSVEDTAVNPDSNAPSGGWNTSEADVVIIIDTPAIDNSNEYIIDPVTGLPYSNELVYFANGSMLFKRTIVDPAASGNVELTSCPEASASSSCPPDLLLTRDFDSLTFTFFDQDNAITVDPSLARSVEMNINLSRDTFGDPILAVNTTQVSFRNRAAF